MVSVSRASMPVATLSPTHRPPVSPARAGVATRGCRGRRTMGGTQAPRGGGVRKGSHPVATQRR
eukprot:1681941-Pleurochrysis_carterae.AAC.1